MYHAHSFLCCNCYIIDTHALSSFFFTLSSQICEEQDPQLLKLMDHLPHLQDGAKYVSPIPTCLKINLIIDTPTILAFHTMHTTWIFTYTP